jgi:very-short-patch-repair endonuclease
MPASERLLSPARQNPVIPFLGSEARRTGAVNRYQLANHYDAVFRDVYVPRGHELTAVDKAVAAWLWSKRTATVAGISAAALHGSLWIDAHLPAELNQRSQHRTRGIVLYADKLWEDEICSLNGILATTPARTAFDLGRRGLLTPAVIRLDALMRATRIKPVDIEALADRHRGARGLAQLRKALRVCDPGAESPQETRTRLTLLDAGLPPPRTQIEIFDGQLLVARVDMGWEEWRVAVEFDGAHHWTDPRQRSRDIERIAELEALGWRIVRVSGEMLRRRPRLLVERVRTALRTAGCPI